VAAARDVRLWDEALRQQIYLGDEAFVERMQALVEPQRAAAREIPKAKRRTTRSLAQWLSTCDSREKALFRAHTESDLTMSAIAK
jgi:putative transposase